MIVKMIEEDKKWKKFEKKVRKIVENGENATCDCFYKDEIRIQIIPLDNDVYFNSLTNIVLRKDLVWKDKVCIRFRDLRDYSIGYTVSTDRAIKIVKSFILKEKK